MTVLGRAVLELATDNTKMKAGLKEGEKDAHSWGDSVGGAAKIAGAAIAAVGVAVVGVATKSALMAASFEKGMTEVATLSTDVQKQLPALSAGVLKLSASMGQDATASAKALYQAISAGVPAENALKFMEVASKAAIGGVTDTETAVDGLTTVLNAFKIPASEVGRVADVMFTAVKAGKTDFTQLSKSMFNVAPLAATLGVSIEEVAAATATLTKSGTPTAVAMTQMRAAMTGLVRESADMAKIMNKAGYENGQAAIKAIGLQGALDLVAKATNGDVGEMSKLLGSVEAVSAALGVTGENAAVFQGDLDAMKNSAGASDKAFALMAGTMDQQMKVAKATLDAVFITIGSQLLPIITPLIKSFAEFLPQAFKAAGDVLGPLLGALKDLFGIISGSAPGAGESLRTAFGSDAATMIATIAATVRDVLVGAFTRMSAWWSENGPLITGVVGALVLAFQDMARDVGKAIGFVKENWDKIEPVVKLAVVLMIPHFVALAGAAVLHSATVVGSWIATHVAAVAGAVIHSAQVVIMVAKWAFLGVQAMLHAAKVAAAWLIAMGPIGLVVLAVAGLVTAVVLNWDKITALTEELVENVKTTLRGIGEFFDTFGTDLRAKANGVGKAIGQGLIAGITGMWSWVQDKIRGLVNLIPEVIRKALGIASPSKVTAALGYEIVTGLAEGIASGAPLVVDAITGVIGRLMSTADAALARSAASFAAVAARLPGTGYANVYEGLSGFDRQGRVRLAPNDPDAARLLAANPGQYVMTTNLVVDGKVLASVVNSANARTLADTGRA